VPVEQFDQAAMNVREAMLECLTGIGLDDATVERNHVSALDSHNAEAQVGRPGIYAHYDSH